MNLALILWAIQTDESHDALKQALKKADDVESYAFKYSTKTDADGLAEPMTDASEGAWQKDVGAAFKKGRIEAVKLKNKFAYRVGDGEWKKLGRKDMSQVYSYDSEDPPDEIDMAIFGLQMWQAPHDLLKQKHGSLKDVKVEAATEKIDDAECVVFACELEQKGWGNFFGGGGKKKDKDKEKEGDKPQYKSKSNAKFWVDDDYHVRKAVIESSYTYDMGGTDYTTTTTETYELSKFGDAKVEIPPDAKKAIESKDEK